MGVTVQTAVVAERVPLPRPHGPLKLIVDSLAARLQIVAPRDRAAVAGRVAAHANWICPKIVERPDGVELRCRTRHLDAVLTFEKGTPYLDIRDRLEPMMATTPATTPPVPSIPVAAAATIPAAAEVIAAAPRSLESIAAELRAAGRTPAPVASADFDEEGEDTRPLVIASGETPTPTLNFPVDLPTMLRDLENAYINAALAQTGSNKKEAARLLGMGRTTLVEKLRRRNFDTTGL